MQMTLISFNDIPMDEPPCKLLFRSNTWRSGNGGGGGGGWLRT